jgi:hypothetical protein
MKKKRLGVGIGTMIIMVGLILGDIQIKVGSNQPKISAKNVHTQLTKLQNISGSFFRSPGESLFRELSSFSATKQNLDVRTYEFTQKDFKTLMKNLAESGVNIRIIVEDKKFKQFQNTLKVVSQEFS